MSREIEGTSGLTEEALRESEARLAGQNAALELAIRGARIDEVLQCIVRTVQEQCGEGARVALFLVDAAGARLRIAAAAGMAEEYTRAVDGLEIGPNNPSCGAVAHTGQTVIVRDVAADPLWAPYLRLAQEHGIRACWSFPIRYFGGEVLGTLAVYHRTPCDPRLSDIESIRLFAQTAALVIARDRAEASLRRSEERFRSLVVASAQVVWTANPEGSGVEDSATARAFTGQTYDQWKGSGWLDALHPDDRERAAAVWREAVRSRSAWTFEHRVRRHDGEYRWMAGRAVPVLEPDGRVREWIGTSTDITDRKEADEERRRQYELTRARSEQLRRLAAVATRLNVAADVAQVTSVVTEEARHLIGAHQAVTSSTIDQNWAQSLNTVSLSDKYARWRSYEGRPDGSGIYSVVCRLNKPLRMTQAELEAHPAWKGFGAEAGRHPPMRGWLAAPLIGRDGKSIGLIQLSDKYEGEFTEDDEAILVQLAQMASVALENARLVESLREADRRKDEFLATLAHELRNPLAPLRNGLELMRLARDDAAVVEKARSMMARQLEQMVRLTDELLDVSRISRGKIELRRERIPLATILSQAAETSRPLIDAGRHRLTIDLPPEPIFLDADLTRLAQVFSNLLNNAAKYTEPGGHITLAAEQEGSDVVVSVRDTGIGIPAHLLPRVFEMFTQVDRSLERSQGGLGIGLSLVKRLVEMHGGSVEARSEGHGKGSELVVRLPAAPPLPGEPREKRADEGAAEANSLRILVVDDNEDAAVSLAMMLEILGNEVQTAHDGLEALEAAPAFRPDVILLDIGMPRLNGHEVARRIRRQPWGKGVLLVALTGWGQEEDRRRSREAGFDFHLVKPVDAAALEKVLAEAKNTH